MAIHGAALEHAPQAKLEGRRVRRPQKDLCAPHWKWASRQPVFFAPGPSIGGDGSSSAGCPSLRHIRLKIADKSSCGCPVSSAVEPPWARARSMVATAKNRGRATRRSTSKIFLDENSVWPLSRHAQTPLVADRLEQPGNLAATQGGTNRP